MGILANTKATTHTNSVPSVSSIQCHTEYNLCMKPIVVRDPEKFDRILGKLIATPPETQKQMQRPPKTSPKR